MDVPLALNDIGIRNGLKGRKRKSSTYYHQTGVVGFSALKPTGIYSRLSTDIEQSNEFAFENCPNK